MCVGNETKPELDELFGPTPTEFLTSKTPKCIRRSAEFNLALHHQSGSNSLYYPQVLATQWRQRSAVPQLVKKLGIDVVHQPTPISPRSSGLLTNFPAPLIIGPMNGAISTSRAFASCNPRGPRNCQINSLPEDLKGVSL